MKICRAIRWFGPLVTALPSLLVADETPPVWVLRTSRDSTFAATITTNEFPSSDRYRDTTFPLPFVPLRVIAPPENSEKLNLGEFMAGIRGWFAWVQLDRAGRIETVIPGYSKEEAATLNQGRGELVVISASVSSVEVKSTSGAAIRHLPRTQIQGRILQDQWYVSPAGNRGVVITRHRSDRPDVEGHLIDMQTGETLRTWAGTMDVSFARNAAKIACEEWSYGEMRGRLAVYSELGRAVTTPWSGSSDAPKSPVITADGEYVFYGKGTGNRLYGMHIATSEVFELDPEPKGPRYFSEDGRHVLLCNITENRISFVSLAEPRNARVLWVQKIEGARWSNAAVSPAGEFVACKVYLPERHSSGRHKVAVLCFDREGRKIVNHTCVEVEGSEWCCVESEGFEWVGERWLFEGVALPGNPANTLLPVQSTTGEIHLFDCKPGPSN